MTPEDYKIKLKEIEDEFENKKKKLAKEYALSNNTIQVGDIFTDHIGSVKVEQILYTKGYRGELPSCVYRGIEVNKNGSPRKKIARRDAYQSNKI